MRGLRVHLLGGLEVEGVEPRRFGSRKARTVLKVLALARGAPVAADRLADCVWGDDLPAQPGEQLAVLVSRLRSVVGTDRLSRSDAGYALRLDWVDVAELEARADEAAALLEAGSLRPARAVAAAALSMVRGELLADEPDAEWAQVERASMARLVARVRLIAAEAALRSGDPLAAADHAGAVLDRDAYDEAALRLLMQGHAAAGRPGSALAAYAGLRKRLGEDLGTSPTPETEALHTSILRDEYVGPVRAARPASRRRLPGRDREMAVLDGALQRAAGGSTVLVVVEGEAGIGKTTLVDTWADRARAGATVVLEGRCDPLGSALPLQPVADALDRHLRALDASDAAALVADDGATLAPILGRAPSTAALVGGLAVPDLGPLVDPALGRTVLFEALLATIVRCGGQRPVALVLDDLHAAGAMTVEWLHFALRRGEGRSLLVVATRRPGEDLDERDALRLPHTGIHLGPLDEAAAAEIVGAERAAELHARSGGHPLFLVELARAASSEKLPTSIRDVVARVCESAGPDAAATLRTAAVLGPIVDVGLLAGVLNLPSATLIDHLETGVRRRLLVEQGDGFAFRHDLLQEALIANVSAARRALVNREAAAVLSRRPDAAPLAVAHHARAGGDAGREAEALVRASAMAAGRFDYAGADTLLTRAISRHDATEARLMRARVRLMLRQFDAARDDATAALAAGAGAEAMEVAAWIAYYRRDHAAAARLADDGARLAGTPTVRARCLTVLGRTRHSQGDVDQAERDLREAAGLTSGPVATVASVWLGAVLIHEGRLDEALQHLAPTTEPGTIGALSLAPAYAQIYGAYAYGLQGRPLDALAFLAQAAEEVRRRQATRLFGVADNYSAWVLRNLGALAEADDVNEGALEYISAEFDEPRGQAELDLVAGRVLAGDPDGARRRLAALEPVIGEYRTFAWRAQLRRLHLSGRVALLEEDWEAARAAAAALAELAAGQRSRRYVVLAAVLAAESALRAGDGVDRDAVDRLLAELPAAAALESWWLTGALAVAAREPRWARLAEDRAAALAELAGPYREALIGLAEARLAPLGRRR